MAITVCKNLLTINYSLFWKNIDIIHIIFIHLLLACVCTDVHTTHVGIKNTTKNKMHTYILAT